jgi:hypothetical protein
VQRRRRGRESERDEEDVDGEGEGGRDGGRRVKPRTGVAGAGAAVPAQRRGEGLTAERRRTSSADEAAARCKAANARGKSAAHVTSAVPPPPPIAAAPTKQPVLPAPPAPPRVRPASRLKALGVATPARGAQAAAPHATAAIAAVASARALSTPAQATKGKGKAGGAPQPGPAPVAGVHVTPPAPRAHVLAARAAGKLAPEQPSQGPSTAPQGGLAARLGLRASPAVPAPGTAIQPSEVAAGVAPAALGTQRRPVPAAVTEPPAAVPPAPRAAAQGALAPPLPPLAGSQGPGRSLWAAAARRGSTGTGLGFGYSGVTATRESNGTCTSSGESGVLEGGVLGSQAARDLEQRRLRGLGAGEPPVSSRPSAHAFFVTHAAEVHLLRARGPAAPRSTCKRSPVAATTARDAAPRAGDERKKESVSRKKTSPGVR